MINEMDIKKALDFNVSTARSRAELNGTEIPMKPQDYDVRQAICCRCEQYLEFSAELKGMVSRNYLGMTDKELEAVEFVREQLKMLSEVAHKELIDKH